MWRTSLGPKVTAILLLACISGLAHGEKSGAPSPHPGWKTHKTEHFVFYHAPTSSLISSGGLERFAQERESALSTICSYLGVTPKRKIYFYIYEDNNEGKRVIGRTLGWAEPNRSVIHSKLGQTVGHEIAHVATYWFAGKSPSLRVISEGFATFMDLTGNDYVSRAQAAFLKGTLPSLSVLESRTKNGEDYPLAAAFVAFLMQQYGPKRFEAACKGKWKNLDAMSLSVYGCSAQQLELAWRESLKNQALQAERAKTIAKASIPKSMMSGKWAVVYEDGEDRIFVFEGGRVHDEDAGISGTVTQTRVSTFLLDFGQGRTERWLHNERHATCSIVKYPGSPQAIAGKATKAKK